MSKTFLCTCGKTIKTGSKSNHIKTKSHRLYIFESRQHKKDELL